jgi:vesicle coat complex subunit
VAVKAAATKFIELAIKEADNNVKLIVLDRVDQLRQKNEGVLDDLTMEILRVLSSPDIDGSSCFTIVPPFIANEEYFESLEHLPGL